MRSISTSGESCASSCFDSHVGFEHRAESCDTAAYGPSARIWPRCSTVIASLSLSTTDRLCSTISTVRLAATLRISSATRSDVLVAHALGRLVEQHQLGVERQRGGDLERALAAVGHLDRQRIGELRQVDRFEQLHRTLVQLVEAAVRAPEVE